MLRRVKYYSENQPIELKIHLCCPGDVLVQLLIELLVAILS
jgi:hypothetical protein